MFNNVSSQIIKNLKGGYPKLVQRDMSKFQII